MESDGGSSFGKGRDRVEVLVGGFLATSSEHLAETSQNWSPINRTCRWASGDGHGNDGDVTRRCVTLP